VRATPSGLAVVGVGLLDNLQANRVILTYLAILFVFLFLSVRLRSIVRALLSLVPVLIAVGAASLFAYAFRLKLSPMTAVGGPLVVAACTEFTSLILLRFVEERRRGLNPRNAVDVTAERTGRAFIVSALTAVAGVGVIATSSLPLLRDFGLVVALNVAVALLSALVFLPPMLVWAESNRHRWVTRGLVPAEVLERAEPEREPLRTR
jgi:predicted RND superfamily exporter protein